MKKIILTLLFLSLILACASCQSRIGSRITGKPLELKLPSDFSKPISFSSGREGEKDLFYIAIDGSYKVKTYTDMGVFESEIIFIKK